MAAAAAKPPRHLSREATEVSVEAGSRGDEARLDDDGRPRRTGTMWTASAHIITAVIGAGVLSLAWAMAQLGWGPGLVAMVVFAAISYYTSTLLANAYRAPHPVTGDRNRTYMDAVRSYLSTRAVSPHLHGQWRVRPLFLAPVSLMNAAMPGNRRSQRGVHVRHRPVRQPVGHHGRLHHHRDHKHGVSNQTSGSFLCISTQA